MGLCQLAQILRIVAINLALGLLTVATGARGRYRPWWSRSNGM
jgi:hypothetical protein